MSHLTQKYDLMDTESILVLDFGSSYIKVGFSGEDIPRLIIPTVLTEVGSKMYIGYDALAIYNNNNIDEVILNYPIERCIIKDYEAIIKILEYIYSNLKIEADKYPVMITVPPLTPSHIKSYLDNISNILFHNFNVPSLCFYNSCVLSLFSTGNTRGLVIEIGDGNCFIVPIYEGIALTHATLISEIAGKDLTSYYSLQFNENIKSPDIQTARDIKEKFIGIHPRLSNPNYELADGTLLTISDEIQSAGEFLFSPEKAGWKGKGLALLVKEALSQCDSFILPDMHNVVLGGGSSCIAGLGDHLVEELKKLDENITIIQDSQRKYSAWIGASMFASMASFGLMKVTKSEYDESQDRSIIHKKYFN